MNFFHNCILSALVLAQKWGHQPRLKKWITLEVYKDKIIKAADGEQDFPKYLLSYLSVAFGINYKWFEYADWTKIVRAFYLVVSKSPQVSLPLTTPSNEKPKEESWSYDGRTWHLYSHLLAKNYGWTLEYISCLQVEEALAKIQEILTDEQLEREFYYGLSEIAYSYDQRSKKSKFEPLPRPHWMKAKVEPEKIKKFAIPASMLPFGVVNPDALPDELLPKKYETKETQHL